MASYPTVHELKQQARRLRQAMSERGAPMAQHAALEVVARQHGARDWNTLSALALRAVELPPSAVRVGARLRGHYLGQAFEGQVLSLSALSGGTWHRIVIEFDQPVDVVTFASFSAYRRRVTAQIDARGVSPRKTSNGVPHLVLDL